MGLSITAQPVSVLQQVGTAATFNVVASHTDITATLYYQWFKDNAAIQGATSDSYSIAAITNDDTRIDSGVYWCVVTDSVDTQSLNTNYVVLACSILDNIELNMKVTILGMTKANGFNFDWQMVNEADEAAGPGYPRALIDSPAETNLDTTEGVNSQAYAQQVLFVVRVKGNQAWSNNPDFTIRSNLRLAKDDLLRLWGPNGNSSVNGSCDEILYRSSQIIAKNQNDLQRPGYLRIQFLAQYSQDRSNPLQYAGA